MNVLIERLVALANPQRMVPIDILQDVLQTCDESMAFLIGDSTSVGTLRDIAQQIENNGPEYMPGFCCLDNPSNSAWFGTRVG